MDSAAQKILAPLIKVNDLRDHGVTLYLQLKSQRERVPDIPVVYFVEASAESVTSICQDLRSGTYDNYYLNFTSQISRDFLEQIAQVAVQSQSHVKISKIYDQYLNYVTLEDNLFSLEMTRVMAASKYFGDISACSGMIDSSVSGIFSVLMTFGCCAPVICSNGSGSGSGAFVKALCAKLEAKIKNHLINTKSPLSLSNPQASPDSPRPLLLIVDRRIDLAAPLKHSSSYNALVDEILGLNANQVQIPGGKSFDIDRRDWFWRENSTKSFPKVAEAVETALKTYKSDYDRVLQTTPGMTEDMMKIDQNGGGGAAAATSSHALTPEQLKIAINVLPELTERKRLIDTHLQISTALLDSLKSRDLGTLFNIEQEILMASSSGGPSGTSSTSTTPEAILTVLKDPKIGNSQDKLRLLLIYLICNYKNRLASSNFVQEALEVLKLAGAELKAFQTVLTVLTGEDGESGREREEISSLMKFPLETSPNTLKSSATSPINPASFGDLFNRISSTTSVLVSSVKSLIPSGGAAESSLTKFIDSSYAQSTGKLLLNNSHFTFSIQDPRPKSSSTTSNIHSIDQIILFIVGGASYSEYDHLLEHFGRSKYLQNLKFTFGATEILSPKKYLSQLSSSSSSSTSSSE